MYNVTKKFKAFISKVFLECLKAKKRSNDIRCFFGWCHQESNRGHKDFQSFALPTELWHHHFLFAVAKVETFYDTAKYFGEKNELFFF